MIANKNNNLLDLSLVQKQIVADKLIHRLKMRYVEVGTLLNADSPWQLLVATVLSAQCTDARVNMVTPKLFALYPDAKSLQKVSQEELEELIKSTGFFRNKAKNLLITAKIIANDYHNQVPNSLEELVKLAGLGRKTANVVLFGAYGINSGIAVDTHVARISYRLGLTKSTNPLLIEQDLMPLFAQNEWGNINKRLVRFGRDICVARKPLCADCEMQNDCLSKIKA